MSKIPLALGRAGRALHVLPRWALLAGAALLLSAADRTAPLRDAVTLEVVRDARLVRPLSSIVLAPLFAVYDALSVLSVVQHLSVLAVVGAAYVGWRALALSRAMRPVRDAALWRTRVRGGARELLIGVAAVVLLLSFYAAGAMAPRPMAALVLDSEDSIIVDFHSHTVASWDSRTGFDLTRRLRWHAGAGFDAVFISDHGTFRGAMAPAALAAPHSPLPLDAAEARHHHQHLILLGSPAVHESLIVDGAIDTVAVRMRRERGDPLPFTILTVPARLAQLPSPRGGSLGIDAIELSVGAPKGIQFAHQHRASLLQLADSLGVPLVAGTNHHGWGSTAPAWNVMTIPGWRELSADRLAERIIDQLREDGSSAVRIVERNTRDAAGGTGSAAAALPASLWYLLSTLPGPERLVWIGWLAVATALALRARARGESRRMRTGRTLEAGVRAG